MFQEVVLLLEALDSRFHLRPEAVVELPPVPNWHREADAGMGEHALDCDDVLTFVAEMQDANEMKVFFCHRDSLSAVPSDQKTGGSIAVFHGQPPLANPTGAHTRRDLSLGVLFDWCLGSEYVCSRGSESFEARYGYSPRRSQMGLETARDRIAVLSIVLGFLAVVLLAGA
jgi:hypothetical protein